MSGTVEAIVLTVGTASTRAVESVRAHAGRGLDGDRHLAAERARPGLALTLIEAEALEGLERDTGIALTHADSQRNLLTRGVDLNALVGRRFTVGGVLCEGVERCEPCRKLERQTAPGVLRGLVHRGGLRADVLSDGVIAVGDEVRPA